MPARKSTSSLLRRVLKGFLIASLLLVGLCLIGCEAVKEHTAYWGETKVPEYQKLSSTYEQIMVNRSLTLDVLPKIDALTGETRSQSESAVASVGQSENGRRSWFTLVAFHQYNLTAIHKYFLFIDEEAKSKRQRGLKFDCEIVLDKEHLGKAGDNEIVRRIAILKALPEYLRADVADVGAGGDLAGQANQKLEIGRLVLNQALKMVLLKLETSPVLVPRLSDPEGVPFEHMSFEKGRIRLVVVNGIATVKLRLGALADRFQEVPVVSTVKTAPVSTQTGN